MKYLVVIDVDKGNLNFHKYSMNADKIGDCVKFINEKLVEFHKGVTNYNIYKKDKDGDFELVADADKIESMNAFVPYEYDGLAWHCMESAKKIIKYFEEGKLNARDVYELFTGDILQGGYIADEIVKNNEYADQMEED